MTRQRTIKSMLLLPALLLTAAVLHAQSGKYAGSFLEIPVGARAMGMGGAFSAIADDGTAFYWNPAGIGLIEQKLLSGMYSSQYGSIGSPLANYYYVGWSMPVNTLSLSINWLRFAISDIPRYDDLTVRQSVEERYSYAKSAVIDETFNDTEDAFIFGVGRNTKLNLNLGWSYFDIPVEIPLGVNFKLLRQSLANNSAAGFGIDAGAMVRFNLKDFFFSNDWPAVSVGATMRDIGGTRINWSETGRPEEIPTTMTYGLALKQPLRFIDCTVNLTADFSNRYEGENRYGAEVEYRRQFNFRCGSNDGALSAGAGVDFNFFHVDYAYLGDTDQRLGQVHRLGLSFNFDKLLEKNVIMKVNNSRGRQLGSLMALVIVSLVGCSSDAPTELTPVPTMVPFVNNPFATTGIRATPNAVDIDSGSYGAVIVEWNSIDASKLSGVRLGGYYLYRAVSKKSSDSLTFSRYQQFFVSTTGDDTTFIDVNVEPGYIYSYYTTSFNKSDESQESSASDTVAFRLDTRPLPSQPQDQFPLPVATPLRFFYGPKNGNVGGYVAIQVDEVALNDERQVMKKVWYAPSVLADYSEPNIEYGGSEPLLVGHRYRWRIIKTAYDGFLPSGNTSKWATFTLQ